MKRKTHWQGLVLAAGCLVSSTQAAVIQWTDWTDVVTDTVYGVLDFGGTTVEVTYSGPYFGVQTAGGTNYWQPSGPYVSAAVDNAPPDPDIIQLGTGGTKTITFSQAVQDPILALVSWNGNTVDFGVPIEILSYGLGYFGSGIPVLNASGTGFYGSGEVHGAIRLPGVYTSITFVDTSEGWHGLTVGAAALAATVPEPAPLALLTASLAGLWGAGRASRNQAKRDMRPCTG